MKRIFTIVVLLLLLANPSMAGMVATNVRSGIASVTATSSNVDFTSISTKASFYNAGSETIFIKFCSETGTCTATTSDMPLYSGMSMNFDPFNTSRIAVVCDTGLASTLAYYIPYFDATISFTQ